MRKLIITLIALAVAALAFAMPPPTTNSTSSSVASVARCSSELASCAMAQPRHERHANAVANRIAGQISGISPYSCLASVASEQFSDIDPFNVSTGHWQIYFICQLSVSANDVGLDELVAIGLPRTCPVDFFNVALAAGAQGSDNNILAIWLVKLTPNIVHTYDLFPPGHWQLTDICQLAPNFIRPTCEEWDQRVVYPVILIPSHSGNRNPEAPVNLPKGKRVLKNPFLTSSLSLTTT